RRREPAVSSKPGFCLGNRVCGGRPVTNPVSKAETGFETQNLGGGGPCVFLSLGIGPNIDPVTVADLDRVFAEGRFEGLAQLGRAAGRDCIQARTQDLYGESEEYRIQWWNPAWPELR